MLYLLFINLNSSKNILFAFFSFSFHDFQLIFFNLPISLFSSVPHFSKSSFRLFEELVAVEREYNELLQTILREKRLRVERLSNLLSDNDNTSGNQQLQTLTPLLPAGFPLSPLVLQTKTSSKISPVCTVSTFQSLEQEPFSRVETSL